MFSKNWMIEISTMNHWMIEISPTMGCEMSPITHHPRSFYLLETPLFGINDLVIWIESSIRVTRYLMYINVFL